MNKQHFSTAAVALGIAARTAAIVLATLIGLAVWAGIGLVKALGKAKA